MSAPLDLLAAAGGQIDASSHGDLTLQLAAPHAAIALYTDTLELRADHPLPHGKIEGARRGEGGAAGLFISPWTDGAPDPARALAASYAGGRIGAQRYLPRGAYLGAQAQGARWWFSPLDSTTIAPLANRTVLQGALGAGLYHDEARRLYLSGGLDLDDGAPAPFLRGEGHFTPTNRRVAPHLEAWGGLAAGESAVTRTRVGGLHPYGVPLAGAGWAEWWAEDYVVGRLGLSMGDPAGVPERRSLRLAMVVDAGNVDGLGVTGLGTLLDADWGGLFGRVHAGYLPSAVRPPGVSRLSMYLSAGWEGRLRQG